MWLFNGHLSKSTSIFGLPLWVVVGVCTGVAIVVILFLIYFSLSYCCRKSPKSTVRPETLSASQPSSVVSKEFSHVVTPERRPGDEHRVLFLDRSSSQASEQIRSTSWTDSMSSMIVVPPEVLDLGWGHRYTLGQLKAVTNGFSEENVIGLGSYGTVYLGVLPDNTRVAVKNLNKSDKKDEEFKAEVEAIGRVRHKTLVKLLGYCVEDSYRMLVYEHVDNGSLDQWLHGDAGQVSPLAWDIRMNIILGTAKGLAYLHEGLEPKVVHRDIKSSNILLDQQWNPKVSDFGLAKLLSTERSRVSTRVMGTEGYVEPEYLCTGLVNEKSDIYSFGVLIMEIISGRRPIDCSRPTGEVYMVDWMKSMIRNRRSKLVVDPKLPERPSWQELRQVLLIALLCLDSDAQERPKMGHVIHMLEANDLPFNVERWIAP